MFRPRDVKAGSAGVGSVVASVVASVGASVGAAVGASVVFGGSVGAGVVSFCPPQAASPRTITSVSMMASNFFMVFLLIVVIFTLPTGKAGVVIHIGS